MQGFLALKRYVQFLGRAGRKEYWQLVGIMVLADVLSIILGNGMAYLDVGLLPPALILTMMFFVPPMYCATIRRLHDRGISGLWLAAIWVLNGIGYTLQNMRLGTQGTLADAPLALLAYANVFLTLGFAIWLFIHLIREGDPQANAYGPPPVDTDQETRNTESMQLVNQALHQLMAGEVVGTAVVQTAPDDRLGQIERLSKLHRDGMLTEAEFQQQKAEILR